MVEVLVAVAAAFVLGSTIALFRRWVQLRAALEERLQSAEERSTWAEAELRRTQEAVHVLQRLLVEKGVADEEDFEAARRGESVEQLSHPRGVH